MDQHEVYICCQSGIATLVADQIVAHLEAQGIACWYVPRNMDRVDYAGRIVEAIENCRLFLIILDRTANESSYAIKELEVAMARERRGENIIILPFRIDDSPLAPRISYHLAAYHFFSCSVSSMDRDIRYLADSVKRLLKNQKDQEEEAVAKKIAAIKPYSGDQNFIFISYSHKNTENIIPVIAELQHLGYRVWYDEGIDPGTEWDDYIAARIEECGCLIAFISKEYLASENCKDELNFARDLGKKRLLVYLEDVLLPRGMAMRLNRIQAIHSYTYNTMEAFIQKLTSAESLEDCC